MSIATEDLVDYGAANRPTDDVSAVGGAIDLTHRPDIIQLTANAVLAIQSDGADTRTLTATGRLPSGDTDTDAIVANGTSEVAGTVTFERILTLVLSAGGAQTLTVRQGTGGATRAVFAPDDVSKSLFFINSESDPGDPMTRYEKFFWRNNHGTLSLLNARVALTADPVERIMIALDAAVNSSAGEANRLTAPDGLVFVDDNVEIAVPDNTLAAEAAIGVWVEQALTAADTAKRSTFTTELRGSST